MPNDTIADALTRIRNALAAGHASVQLPKSKIVLEIIRILATEQLIGTPKDQGLRHILVPLRGPKGGQLTGLRRISKPGLRVYVGYDEIPHVLGGVGLAILSTPAGVFSDHEIRSMTLAPTSSPPSRKLGGEVLCYVW